MPNWCNTRYAVIGDEVQVRELSDMMAKLESGSIGGLPNEMERRELSNLVYALGERMGIQNVRGVWGNLMYDGIKLMFETTTSWRRSLLLEESIKKHFPMLTVFFISEEPMMGIYETNDQKASFFPDQYILIADGKRYQMNVDELMDYVRRKCGCDINSFSDVLEVIEKANNKLTDIGLHMSIIKFSCNS